MVDFVVSGHRGIRRDVEALAQNRIERRVFDVINPRRQVQGHGAVSANGHILHRKTRVGGLGNADNGSLVEGGKPQYNGLIPVIGPNLRCSKPKFRIQLSVQPCFGQHDAEQGKKNPKKKTLQHAWDGVSIGLPACAISQEQMGFEDMRYTDTTQ